MKTGMCWWRFRGGGEWKFGYCTHVVGEFYRMGRWNGDRDFGPVVDRTEIEQRDYE